MVFALYENEYVCDNRNHKIENICTVDFGLRSLSPINSRVTQIETFKIYGCVSVIFMMCLAMMHDLFYKFTNKRKL